MAGCVTAQPAFTPQELAAVRESAATNEALAQAHKITWVEAAKREVSAATMVAGDRMDDTTRLTFSYKIALASEVDAGHITPEVMSYRYAERLQQNRAAIAAQEQQQREAFAAGMMAMGQGFQNASQAYQQSRPLNCTSNAVGTMTYTNCY